MPPYRRRRGRRDSRSEGGGGSDVVTGSSDSSSMRRKRPRTMQIEDTNAPFVVNSDSSDVDDHNIGEDTNNNTIIGNVRDSNRTNNNKNSNNNNDVVTVNAEMGDRHSDTQSIISLGVSSDSNDKGTNAMKSTTDNVRTRPAKAPRRDESPHYVHDSDSVSSSNGGSGESGAASEDGEIQHARGTKRRRLSDSWPQSNRPITRSADLLMPLPIPPWVEHDRRYPRDPVAMLQTEIEDYVKYLRPTPAEHAMRQLTVERIARVVRSLWPKAKTHVFGSFETKLYLPSSDIDIVVMDNKLKAPGCLYQLSQRLRLLKMESKMLVIAKARVPIIKMVDALTGFSVDISFNVDSGLDSMDIVKKFLSDPTIGDGLLPLMLIMKQFLLQRNLNEVYTGGMGSYALVIIIAAFLKMHPKLQSGQIRASQNLGILLMEFLELYGYHFNYTEIGLAVHPDRGVWYFRKNRMRFSRPLNPQGMCILDPQDETNDVGGGTKAWPAIRHEFMRSHRLLNAMIGSAYERRGDGRPTTITTMLGSILTVRKEVIEFRENVRDRMAEIADKLENGSTMDDIYTGSIPIPKFGES